MTPWAHGGRLALFTLAAQAAAASLASVSGAWIDNKLAPTQQAMNTTAHELARLGVNRIFVDAWNKGNVYFPSSTVATVCPTCVASADLLRWAADASQSAGLSVCAWFECGLMSGYALGATNTLTALAKQRGWYAGDGNGFHLMDPSNPMTSRC